MKKEPENINLKKDLLALSKSVQIDTPIKREITELLGSSADIAQGQQSQPANLFDKKNLQYLGKSPVAGRTRAKSQKK